MGHVRALPTLDELHVMRSNFAVKASPASRLSAGGIALQPNPATEDVAPTARAVTAASQADTLRVAQRHAANIALWFESEVNGQEASGETGCGGEGIEDSPLSSAIKAVYLETWGEDDGRLGGLDLLLTLCAVPSDSAPVSPPAGADVVHDRDKGELCCRRAGCAWEPAEGTLELLRFSGWNEVIHACIFVMVPCTDDALACLCLVASPSCGLAKYTTCQRTF